MIAMAQIHFTLDWDYITSLFSESKDVAFGKLMEAILNQVLKAESAEQLGAEDYERTDNRSDYRNGTRTRGLITRIGKIELQVPRHRKEPFKTMLFDNYQRNEQALIAAMMEMVVQGVSTRKVEKVTEELCGEKFSKSTVSEICQTISERVNEFKDRLLPDRYPFIIADALYIKVRENHRVVSKAFFIAIGVNETGCKEVIGLDLFDAEREDTWKTFFSGLKARGLHGVDFIISDDHQGLVKAVKECFTGVCWQRCQVHFERNIMLKTPKRYQAGLTGELRSMFNAATLEEARRLKTEIIDEYQDVASEAMEILDNGFEDSMAIMALPMKYRRSTRSSNIIERENREIRRREQVIQIFPNQESAIRVIGALLLDHHDEWQDTRRRIFSMTEYYEKLPSIKKKLMSA